MPISQVKAVVVIHLPIGNFDLVEAGYSFEIFVISLALSYVKYIMIAAHRSKDTLFDENAIGAVKVSLIVL